MVYLCEKCISQNLSLSLSLLNFFFFFYPPLSLSLLIENWFSVGIWEASNAKGCSTAEMRLMVLISWNPHWGKWKNFLDLSLCCEDIRLYPCFIAFVTTCFWSCYLNLCIDDLLCETTFLCQFLQFSLFQFRKNTSFRDVFFYRQRESSATFVAYP